MNPPNAPVARQREGRALTGPPPLLLRFAAMLMIPVVVYALYATGQKALDNYTLSQQAARLRLEVSGLRDQNLALQQEILRARTDAAIESVARAQLGLARPGDQPVAFVGASPRVAPPLASPPPAPPPPAWRQWWNLFFSPLDASR